MDKDTKKKILENYAKLIVEVGINVKKGDKVVINFGDKALDLVREVQKELYKKGALKVLTNINDEEMMLNRFLYADDEALKYYPEFEVSYLESLYKEKYARISIGTQDPQLLKDVDTKKIKLSRETAINATGHLSRYMDAGDIKWFVGMYPNEAWAKSVFPDLSEEEALEKLWDKVIIALRLDKEDPVLAWKEHNDNLKKYEKWLDEQNFEKLHYEAPGTDLMVYLAKDHKWVGGTSTTPQGVDYMANMPTEEIFTAPHMDKVDGTLRATKPLSFNGKLIEDMNFEFKDGKVCKFTASKNGEILEEMMKIDDGGMRLGEAAIVSNSSPIAKAEVIFNNGLYDENAACHFALGKSYAETIKNGEKLSEEELKERGANESKIHVDFMIGSGELNITGYKANGEKIKFFVNGEFSI